MIIGDPYASTPAGAGAIITSLEYCLVVVDRCDVAAQGIANPTRREGRFFSCVYILRTTDYRHGWAFCRTRLRRLLDTGHTRDDRGGGATRKINTLGSGQKGRSVPGLAATKDYRGNDTPDRISPVILISLRVMEILTIIIKNKKLVLCTRFIIYVGVEKKYRFSNNIHKVET